MLKKVFFTNKRAILKEENLIASDEELDRMAYIFVADPDIAGLQLVENWYYNCKKNGENIDMRRNISDFDQSDKMMTFSANITNEQRFNRMILHDTLVSICLLLFMVTGAFFIWR